MTGAGSKTITTILVMLLVLALTSAVSIGYSQLAFGRRGNNRPAGQSTTGQGTTPGNNNGTNNRGTGTNFQGRNATGIFSLFSVTRSLGINPLVMTWVSLGFSILGIVLLLLCAYGIWKSKVWGLNWGMFLAIVFLLGALPGLFSMGGRNVNWVRSGLNILSLVATLPILVLGVLPSVRDYFPKPVRRK
jgi:uncharacterized membrane protein